MSATAFYIIETILALAGIGVILAQDHPEEGSSFFATSVETFKLQSTKDRVLFGLTVVIIILFLVVLYLHNTML